MKRLIILILVIAVVAGIVLFVNRSIPYSDRADLLSAEVSIDSIWILGPAAVLYDSTSRRYFWLKSYSSLDQSALDTLARRRAKVRYMKFLKGPLENRIFRMEVDSVVVFDQVVELE